MTKLLVVFATALVLAYFSEQNTRAAVAAGHRYVPRKDWAYVLLVTVLVLFTGLRTSYNDTWNYIKGYQNAPKLSEWLANPDNYNLFKNPLFHLLQSAIKSIADDAQVMIFLSALITQVCFIYFFKRYSKDFTFNIFLYFTLGTFCLSMAAIKQVLAMSIATLAFPFLERRQWGRFYFAVFVATLFHTYVLSFAVLPFFRQRPWKQATFFVMLVLLVVLVNFRTAIGEFMEQANELGKNLQEFEVFGEHTINLFRLAVYAVPPLISLVFMRWIFSDSTKTENLLVNMSILSLACMSLGTQAGANMFGRMGNYFELGTICCLPWMLKKTFTPRSFQLISAFACICFFGFFIYANLIGGDFGAEYRSITLVNFISKLLS